MPEGSVNSASPFFSSSTLNDATVFLFIVITAGLFATVAGIGDTSLDGDGSVFVGMGEMVGFACGELLVLSEVEELTLGVREILGLSVGFACGELPVVSVVELGEPGVGFAEAEGAGPELCEGEGVVAG